MKKAVFLINLGLLLGGCSLAPQRSFYDEMDGTPDEMFVPNRDFPIVQGDSGAATRSRREILMRTPASKMEREKLFEEFSLEDELSNLENELDDDDYNHYLKYREKLKTHSERIYFLKLGSIVDKEEYLVSKNLYDGKYSNVSPQENNLIAQHEVAHGMTKDAVLKSWGKPIDVEVAGNPRNENERWVYKKNGRREFVYFEGGVVDGLSSR